MVYCECETPVIDVEHDAGCRRCGRPVNFAPSRLEAIADKGGWGIRDRASGRFLTDGHDSEEDAWIELAGAAYYPGLVDVDEELEQAVHAELARREREV